MLRRTLSLTAAALLALTSAACGTFRETLPQRSASEQFILSAAADRAVAQMPTGWLRGRTVYLDTANLDCYDKAYVVQRLRNTILSGGGFLAGEEDQADAVLEAASGGFSVDKGAFLVGFPEVPLPVPLADQTLVIPELPLFKVATYRGKSKLLLTAIDKRTNGLLCEIPNCYGMATWRIWQFMLLGPFHSTDVPHRPGMEEELAAKK